MVLFCICIIQCWPHFEDAKDGVYSVLQPNSSIIMVIMQVNDLPARNARKQPWSCDKI